MSTPLDLASPPSAAAVTASDESITHAPPSRVTSGAHCSSMAQYQAMHARSLAEPAAFWAEMARSELTWFRDFTEV